jgi:hypothetical protein
MHNIKIIIDKLNNFPDIISMYNNVPDNILNGYKGDERKDLVNYIKVMLITKILSISGPFLDINYSGNHVKMYNADYGLLIMNNRKNVVHTKSSKMFVIDLLSHVKNRTKNNQNEIIVSLFDLCTVPI